MAKWSRERIIREILRREASGLSLDLGGADPVHSTLYQAASRVFGPRLDQRIRQPAPVQS